MPPYQVTQLMHTSVPQKPPILVQFPKVVLSWLSLWGPWIVLSKPTVMVSGFNQIHDQIHTRHITLRTSCTFWYHGHDLVELHHS